LREEDQREGGRTPCLTCEEELRGELGFLALVEFSSPSLGALI
jgi:hypothetical protein